MVDQKPDLEVIGIGYPCVDIITKVDHLPGSDESLPMQDYTIQGGGKVSTALVALARLGDDAGIVGKVGEGFCGKFIKKDFKKHGVDSTNLLVEDNQRSPFSVVISNSANQSRNIIWDTGSLEAYSKQDFDLNFIDGPKFVHMARPEEYELQLAAELRDKSGVQVVYDGDFYEPSVLDLLPNIDVLISSREFGDDFAEDELNENSVDYEKVVKALNERGPDIVIITLGKDGAVGLTEEGLFSHNAYEVDVVDTTGAGDVYHGAFIHGLLNDFGGKGSARFAAAVSALKTTGMGGRANIPTEEDVERFLRSGEVRITDREERQEYYKVWMH